MACPGNEPVQRAVPRAGGGDATAGPDAGAGISTSFDIHDVVANDEHAVALVHLHLEVADGRRYDQPQVQVAHVQQGRIVEFWTMNQDQAVLDLLVGG